MSLTVTPHAVTNEVRYVHDGRLVVQERHYNPQLSTTYPQRTVTYTRGLDLSGSLEGAGGIGGLLDRTDSTASGPLATAYYHSDGNGNVTLLIDTTQNVAARYDYDPFGNTLALSGPLAAVNMYRFSSKEVNPATGLYAFGERFYHPHLQRWLNRDPLGIEGGVNLYAYVGNGPTYLIDPWGTDFMFTLSKEVAQRYRGMIHYVTPMNAVFGIGYNGQRVGVMPGFQDESGLHEALVFSAPDEYFIFAEDPYLIPEADVTGSDINLPEDLTLGSGRFNEEDKAKIKALLAMYAAGSMAIAGGAGVAMIAAETGAIGGAAGAATDVGTDLVAISRWGRPGLQSGDWVMNGQAGWGTYIRSFKWQPGMGNQFAGPGTGRTYFVPRNAVQWPKGWGRDGWWKGIFGQRKYLPKISEARGSRVFTEKIPVPSPPKP